MKVKSYQLYFRFVYSTTAPTLYNSTFLLPNNFHLFNFNVREYMSKCENLWNALTFVYMYANNNKEPFSIGDDS